MSTLRNASSYFKRLILYANVHSCRIPYKYLQVNFPKKNQPFTATLTLLDSHYNEVGTVPPLRLQPEWDCPGVQLLIDNEPAITEDEDGTPFIFHRVYW